MKFLVTFLCVCVFARLATSYKILVVFPMPAPSHFILGSSLAKGLLQAGHEVSMLAPFEEKSLQKNQKYKEYILDGFAEEKERGNLNMFEFEKSSPFMQIPFLAWVGNEVVNKTLHHPTFQKLLKSTDHYDAVIIEQFNDEGLKVLAYHFKAPQILFSTINANRWFNPLVGNPEPPSYIPDIFTSFSVPMSFGQRLTNFIFGLSSDLIRHFYFFPSQEKLMKQAYPNAPDLDDILYNVSLVLVNSHESTNQPVPHVPNMVDIGGFHIGETKPLPKDLQDYMDSAKDGVVYFSMGSNLVPSMMPKETLDVLLKTLGKLKQKVLWKWNEENLANKPENVKISKWFPQRDLLAHPNCKLFITHGGLLSTTETVYNGVPILAFPVFGDQKLNAARAASFGYGISLPFSQITEETLGRALKDLLETPKYRENAKTRSAIMHDRIVKPMDTAVYWVEYVIRHKGAPHLRVAAVNLPWYQYLLLDVIGFLILVILCSILALYLIIKKCCSRKPPSKVKVKAN